MAISLSSPLIDKFSAFYDQYVPKLWGIILSANLPSQQAETILLNTLIKAWPQIDLSTMTEGQVLVKLLVLACREGLPNNYLRAALRGDSTTA